MYVNRFFLFAIGPVFALLHITETDNPDAEEGPHNLSRHVEASDGTTLWNWGARLYWTYGECVEAVESYARGTLMLDDTRVELIDMRHGVVTQVAIYDHLSLKGGAL